MADINLSGIAAGTGGFVINGQGASDSSGWSVASAGDVNGDGLTDLIVGAPNSDPAVGGSAGRSYVVFGRTSTSSLNLSAVALGNGGFVINGQCLNDFSGRCVAGAGDVNGDGLTDLFVGASNGTLASYVIFGKTGTSEIDLSAVAAGTGGFVIDRQSFTDHSGDSVANAGDVNGDGLADLIVGAPFASNSPASGYAGRSYVIFGKTDTGAVSVSAVVAGTGGFVIHGQCALDESGGSVSGAGDVNGDGLADLIVGALRSDRYGSSDVGRSYVVFGKTGTGTVNLSAVAEGTGGFVINGQCAFDRSGVAVANAGDVNGDGLGDLIVGVPYSRTNFAGSFSYAGRSYVVFGKTGTAAVNVANVAGGVGGFVIDGQSAGDRSGISVAGAGDVNGDGLADLIVGAPNSGSPGGSGRSYVVFGKTGTAPVNLSTVAAGTGGFVINGQCFIDASGHSVAGAGDVNGDGLADLIVGAHGSDSSTGNDAGRSYVIFGATGGAFAPTAVDWLGGSGNDVRAGTSAAQTLVGGRGNDTLTGNGGADVLYGGSGNDIIVVNASNIAALSARFGAGGNVSQLSRVDGGSGLDTLKLDGAGIALNLSSIAAQGAGGPASTSRIEGIERIDLTGGGNNTLTLAVADIFDLSDSSNTLRVDGNAGDAVSLTDAGFTVVSTSGGYHQFTKGAAVLQVKTQVSVTLVGGDGLGDVLTGTSSADTILGLGGNDTLTGGGGADTLIGGSGNDILKGLAGADILTGGTGKDTFDFDARTDSGTSSSTRDTIRDFKASQQDRIDLSDIDAKAGGGDNEFAFIGTKNFSSRNASGQLRFDADKHLLLGSIDADSDAEFSILLTGISSMTGSNFIL